MPKCKGSMHRRPAQHEESTSWTKAVSPVMHRITPARQSEHALSAASCCAHEAQALWRLLKQIKASM